MKQPLNSPTNVGKKQFRNSMTEKISANGSETCFALLNLLNDSSIDQLVDVTKNKAGHTA